MSKTSSLGQFKYIPKAVSRFFRLDWNFALRIVRIQILSWISPLIFATGVYAKLFPTLKFDHPQVRLLWIASTLFFAGFLLLRLRAPLFLQEYKHFKEFEAFGHAHRWVVWQLSFHFKIFADQRRLLNELIDKGLLVRASAPYPPKFYRVCPILKPPTRSGVLMHSPPVNLNNDIYLAFDLDGVRYILPVQESDPNLERGQRELFWILFSACANARPVSRGFVWFLFLAAGIVLVLAIGVALAGVFLPAPEGINYSYVA